MGTRRFVRGLILHHEIRTVTWHYLTSIATGAPAARLGVCGPRLPRNLAVSLLLAAQGQRSAGSVMLVVWWLGAWQVSCMPSERGDGTWWEVLLKKAAVP